jgi:chemotaxis protein MotB
MARKAAWEEFADSDLGPYAKSRGTRWGRVFIGLLLVGAATFVAAYYLPLYRAHQKLDVQYRELAQKSQTLSDSVSRASAELTAAQHERDQLRAERDQKLSAQKDVASQQEGVRATLASKLDKLVKKNSVAIFANGSTLLVALDSALLFQPQRLDLAPAAHGVLCDVVKGSEAKALAVGASLAPGAAVPAALSKSYANPWTLSAARAAAIAQALTELCAFPGPQVSATGNADHDPFAAQLASSKLAADRIELAFTPR